MPRRPSTAEIAADKRRDLLTYAVGYGLALAPTLLAFALVCWRWAEPPLALAIVFGLVHFRCFLHIDSKRQSRDDLLLVLFSTPTVSPMVGGTLVVLFNLRARVVRRRPGEGTPEVRDADAADPSLLVARVAGLLHPRRSGDREPRMAPIDRPRASMPGRVALADAAGRRVTPPAGAGP